MLWRHYATAEQINWQYDVGTHHPPARGVIRRKETLSASARADYPCTLNVPYGDTARQVLDIFPAEQENAPVIVFIHGGYWRSVTSTKDTSSFVAHGTRPRGYTLVTVEYDLCPNVTLEALIAQVRASVEWVIRNISAHGGDPARIHVTGTSAGGHLTAMVAATDWAARGLPADAVKGATALSGLYDLTPFQWGFLAGDLKLDKARIAACSPVTQVPEGGCPIQLLWGGLEPPEFEWQARQLEGAWSRAGNPVVTCAIPERDHFTISLGFLEGDDTAFGRAFWPFVARCNGGTP
ncbi:alpha/beta hydrolase [Oceanicola sp. 22II-s10i]|uniref:alpha/beta hydrolase n=1 Tax=Oceanicola sp. 22II-s10i TaxID=1317116 RepID=UPI000B522195|nr:alpha/beta hydrolase [Oceanicola sp. 22II-s10i]